MYPVPDDLDLSPLVGGYLTQIGVGPNDLQLNFNRPVSPGANPSDSGISSIACEGDVRVEIGGESGVLFGRDGWGDVSTLPKIAGRDVTAWSRDGSHEFSVTLAGDAVIRFRSEDGPYEDFLVSVGTKQRII